MRTDQDIMVFTLGSPHRKEIVKTLLEYPNRLWTASAMENATKISHATVYRTLTELEEFGMLDATKVNKKDIVYQVVNSPLSTELKKITSLKINQEVAKKVAEEFVKKIGKKDIASIILYGSTVRGNCTAKSDIDILIIVKKRSPGEEKEIQDKAAEISLRANKVLSIMIMDEKEIEKEMNSQFIRSLKENWELVYGKKPF